MRYISLLTMCFVTACESGELMPAPTPTNPYVDRVVAFLPGPNAGFGQAKMPEVVFGPPQGGGLAAGGLDVVSLGNAGTLVVAFDDLVAVDGPGPDLLVFENAFTGFVETGRVSASVDGVIWVDWPCDPVTTLGCAGVRPVFSAPGNGIAATDPAKAGGDAFDLAVIGLASARYMRIVDTGANKYEGVTGGFDLDAVAVLNGKPLAP